MNSKERVNLALRREVPDRVPFDLSGGFVGAAWDKFVRRSGSTDHFAYFDTDVEFYELLEPRAEFDYAGRVLPGTYAAATRASTLTVTGCCTRRPRGCISPR